MSKRFCVRVKPDVPVDSWCTRSQIAGYWVDWHTVDGEPTEQEVRDVADPPESKRKQDAEAAAIEMLADSRRQDPVLAILRDLTKRVEALERKLKILP